jgi:hypothetical protein
VTTLKLNRAPQSPANNEELSVPGFAVRQINETMQVYLRIPSIRKTADFANKMFMFGFRIAALL